MSKAQSLAHVFEALKSVCPSLKAIQVFQDDDESSAYYAHYRAVCEYHRKSAVTVITACLFEQQLICAPAFNIELTVLTDGRIKLRADANDLKRLFTFAYTVIENTAPTWPPNMIDNLREAIIKREGSCQVIDITGEHCYLDKIKELEKAGNKTAVVRAQRADITYIRYPHMDIELRCFEDGKLTGNVENFAKLFPNSVVVPKQ